MHAGLVHNVADADPQTQHASAQSHIFVTQSNDFIQEWIHRFTSHASMAATAHSLLHTTPDMLAHTMSSRQWQCFQQHQISTEKGNALHGRKSRVERCEGEGKAGDGGGEGRRGDGREGQAVEGTSYFPVLLKGRQHAVHSHWGSVTGDWLVRGLAGFQLRQTILGEQSLGEGKGPDP